MAKIKFECSEPYVSIGTIDYVDHGKTTLTTTITKVLHDKYLDLNEFHLFDQVDDALEECGRDITINASHVEYQTEKCYYAHVDAPSRADYMKNIVTDTAQMDGAILVVAATDSPIARTREHVFLTRWVNVPTILVALNKSDMVDDEEMLKLVEEEYRDLPGSRNFNRDTPIIKVFALKTLEGDEERVERIVGLMNAVDELIPTPERGMDKPLLISIEDVFTIIDRGTVVADRIERGKLPISSEVKILGVHDPQKIIVTGIETFHKSMGEVWAGKNCDLLLRGIRHSEAERGQVVVVPGSITLHTNLTGQVYTLKKEESGRHNPFFLNYRPQFYPHITDVAGVTTLPEGADMVMSGDTTEITVELTRPIAMESGLGFAIREGGHIVDSDRMTAIEK